VSCPERGPTRPLFHGGARSIEVFSKRTFRPGIEFFSDFMSREASCYNFCYLESEHSLSASLRRAARVAKLADARDLKAKLGVNPRIGIEWFTEKKAT
jgi:hypothetical protein